ncbi:MAG TPA: DUF2332 family protein [Allosphingosinicella sp.]|jgi:hypothetical protein|nr:DUF2332 family protein [Allosphingosinicella sp.]
MARGEAVREAFREQARWCERLGSPFTARLCAALAETLDPGTPLGARVLDWPGEPMRDALALRLCGGLHALGRAGQAPDLAPLYPPGPPPSDEALLAALWRTLAEQAAALDTWLDGAPQTNEVGRSAVLMSGLLVVADRFRLPLRLFELGASAGLNLQLDRYGYDLGGLRAGDPQSPVQLAPEWKGAAPPQAAVRIAARSGVDLNPVDPVAQRERLLAYVWPDQHRRLAQLEAALDLAAADPPQVDEADAADWLEARLRVEPEPGVCRVVLHSVAYQYFPPESRRRIRARLEAAGAAAQPDAALAWLRFEMVAGEAQFSLRLRTWPGEERLLAWSHPHGNWVEWLA